MTPLQANDLLSDANIQQTALVLAALDYLQAEDFNLMEPHLRELGRFSESDTVVAANKAVRGHACMALPGNGQGIKMNLSVLCNSLQVIGRHEQMEKALKACEEFETLAIDES